MSFPVPDQTCWVVLPSARWTPIFKAAARAYHAADLWLATGLEDAVTIAEVRALQKFAAQTPVGEKKMAIVGGAHALRAETANALLKLLEEPPNYLQILLIGESEYLLPTLVSRSRKLEPTYFASLEAEGESAAPEPTNIQAWQELLNRLDPAQQAEREKARRLLMYQKLLHQTVNQPLVLDAFRNSKP